MKKGKLFWSVICILLIIGGFIAYETLWNHPLSPSLSLSTPSGDSLAPAFQPTIASTLSDDPPVVAASTPPGDPPAPAFQPTIASTASNNQPVDASTQNSGETGGTKPTICDGPETLTILAIGSDYRGGGGDYLYGLADVIRIVRIDFTKPSVSVLAIPRDLWVYIPGLGDHYGKPGEAMYGKINQAYLFGTPGMGYFQGSGGGAGYLADTLYYNFGIFPDHYVVVSMKAVEDAIDAVGGVDITLDKPVDGNYGGGDSGYYAAGTHHFDGATALKFARIRYGYSDLTRIDNQTLVLLALGKKATSPEVLPQLPQIISSFYGKKVLTDLSPADISMFLCLARQLDPGEIKFVSLPADTYSAEKIFSQTQNDIVFAYVPDTNKVIEVINNFKSGIWP
jgi:LCP family protein required for cell wall assembly